MKLSDYLEQHICELIKGKKHYWGIPLLKGFLYLLSLCYATLVYFRNWVYDNGLVRRSYPKLPVISIGNIVAGGTGKTPFTILLAEAFAQHHSIAILSRGYKSPAEKRSFPLFLSTGSGVLYPAAYAGDEPYLIASRLPSAVVIVGRNRIMGVEMALQTGVKAVILDDGLQYRKLSRDLDIIMLNTQDPFGHNFYLPRGFLRDSPQSLSRADLVVINHYSDAKQDRLIRDQIKIFSQSPIISTKSVVKGIYNRHKDSVEIKNKKVGLFCGIAHPESFEASALSAGAILVAKRFFPDHYPISEEDLKSFERECLVNGAEGLLCTEKDFVKMAHLNENTLPIFWLEIGLEVVEGKEEWKTFLHKVEQLL